MSGAADGRRYRLVEALGKGGFGTVYRAELLGAGGFQKPVALKVLNPEVEGAVEVARRLRDEARVLGLLRHRAIVAVDGLVQLNGRWTVVMEYVDGTDLRSIIKTAGRVPEGSALEIAGEVAAALHVAWEQAGPNGMPLRLLHRDIKPSNIQITAAGEVKLLDFGVARAEFGSREAITRTSLCGSLGYMSPERLDLSDGPGGDIYSLGVTLWEMVAAEVFGQTSAHPGRHEARRKAAINRAQELGVSEPTVRLIDRMIAYEPGDRPPAADLERTCIEMRGAISGEPLRYWSERTVRQVRGTARRTLDSSTSGNILVEQAVSQSEDPWAVLVAPKGEEPESATMPYVSGAISGAGRRSSSEERETSRPRLVVPEEELDLDPETGPSSPVRPAAPRGTRSGTRVAYGVLAFALLGLLAAVAWKVVGDDGSVAPLPTEEAAVAPAPPSEAAASAPAVAAPPAGPEATPPAATTASAPTATESAPAASTEPPPATPKAKKSAPAKKRDGRARSHAMGGDW